MVKYYLKDLIDGKIPSNCIEFNCGNSNLSSLPELPQTLKYLYCSNNNLSYLQELPQTLIDLDCYNNKINKFPKLPQSLTELWCNNNNIKYISYENCQIIKKLKYVDVLNNPISANFTNNDEFISSLE